MKNAIAIAALIATLPLAAQAPAGAPDARTVDLAICLDTSGSMQGLIDAARTRIWSIVNDLALAKPTPRLRVALLTYGNTGHDAAAGWVRVDSGFTEDLDLISQQLFALTTNGGTELVGRVLKAATEQLAWSADPQGLRLILVAGNESADQDQEVRYPTACKDAITKGIQVNAIYCGNAADDIAPGWREVAKLADGTFAAIDQNLAVAAIETPFDARLAELNDLLNRTYVPWGKGGADGAANQVAQDANAARSSVAAERSATKASGLYRCGWDLLDACKDGAVKLEEVKDEDLPEEMRAMDLAARKAHLEARRAEREKVQAEMRALNEKRVAHVAEEQKKRAAADDGTFGQAVRTAIREQAKAKGFTFGS